MKRNTIKGHGFKVGDLVDYFGRDESATDQADRTILSKEGTVYVLTVVGGEFDGTRIAKFGAASKIWAAPVATEPVAPVIEEGQRYVSHRTGIELTVTRVDRKADGTVARVIVRNESDGFIGWHEDFVQQVTDGDLSPVAAYDFTQDGVTRRITVVNWEGGERGHYVCFVDTQGDRGSLHSNAWNMAMAMGDLVKITDGAPDFTMALVDQDARTAKISAPVAFRLGRGKRKASKRQARRNRGVSK